VETPQAKPRRLTQAPRKAKLSAEINSGVKQRLFEKAPDETVDTKNYSTTLPNLSINRFFMEKM
jgi:hypothetical protein